MTQAKRGGVGASLRRWLGASYLRLAGWTISGEIPSEKKYVIIAAPHTSYWDMPNMLAFAFATNQNISFLMKDSFFVGPLGPVFRSLGGVSVDRSVSSGMVESVASEFDKRDELAMVIAPEGTRSKREYWKSGFYHVARQAGVPIALGFMDYSKKQVGYGPLFWPKGEGDEELLRAFYADKRGLYPEKETPPRLRSRE